jgi:hypothetical protein
MTIITTASPCPRCRGLLLKDYDLETLRHRCLNCGWYESPPFRAVPLRQPPPLEQARDIMCLTCRVRRRLGHRSICGVCYAALQTRERRRKAGLLPDTKTTRRQADQEPRP